MKPGNYFSYPNRSTASKLAIRNRVLNTINSTWGTGDIKMVTWSFQDTTMKNALAAARDRGVKVTVIAARSVNNDGEHPAWPALRAELNQPGDTSGSHAWECSGACRGAGGTAHAKYFLFNDVGSYHRRNIVMQTSMNLTRFAFEGQWNQATVWWSEGVYRAFSQVFELARTQTRGGVRSYRTGGVTSTFFPGASRSNDVILRALNNTRCTGATAGGINGRTRVRLINYAIYQDRGTAIAKRLRQMWNGGCNVRIIYSLTSRPVLSILRSRAGRGPVPMRQSVIKNGRGEIVKYNHSKWLAISGVYAGRGRGIYTVLPGSANWADLSYSSDEQTQQIFSSTWTRPYFGAFDTTWNQKTSRAPSFGRVGSGARALNSIPEQPTWGRGQYKYLTPEGG
jgi:PLD-like domain